jgi:ribosomal protein S6--L-glutamate ligase
MMKRLVLFTTEESSWIAEKISEKIGSHSASLLIVNPTKMEMSFTDKIALFVDGKEVELTEEDVVLPRINEHDLLTKIGHLLNFSDQCRLVNSVTGAMYANDKFISQVLFTGAGFKTPATYMIGNDFFEKFEDKVKEFFDDKFPVIVKTRQGTHGTGVMLVDSAKALKSLAQYLHKSGEKFLLQEFIPHEFTYRILTLGDKVLAANKRSVGKTEFRSNAHAGAETVAHEPSDKEVDVCIRAAKLFGLEFSAVDYLIDEDGEVVLFEINASPGLENIQTNFTDKDLVNELLSYVVGENSGEVQTAVDDGSGPEQEDEKEATELTNSEAELIIHKINDWQPIIARVDTGAGLSSLHGSDVKVDEKSKKVTFTSFDKTYTVDLDRHVLVKNSNGKTRRPVVKFDVSINGRELKGVDFTISTRDDLSFNALIGRNILTLGGFNIVFESEDRGFDEEL